MGALNAPKIMGVGWRMEVGMKLLVLARMRRQGAWIFDAMKIA